MLHTDKEYCAWFKIIVIATGPISGPGLGCTPDPAGIYQVQSTVFVPVGSILVGEGWSQIMAEGPYFQNASEPQVMVRVGLSNDTGVIEMSDLLFTVRGPTAGAILVEWNVQESTQGSAGMWDCHFRVGGATGTDLQMANCPKLTGSVNTDCMAATMLLYLTDSSSGYFENVWAWVADHDLDVSVDGANTTTSTQINIYGARGVLIESLGPTWLYGASAEHSVMYQYQLDGAQDIFMSHIQTETPYFQPDPDASQPYTIGTIEDDPTFEDCESGSNCEDAWALRVLNSQDIFIYSAGFYSFFEDYDESCVDTETCQLSLVETSYTEGLWLYNIFTKGGEEVVSPAGGIPPLLKSASNQTGYTTEISVWLVLALTGADIGSSGDPEDTGSGIVYIGPTIYVEPTPTIQCFPPCSFIFPPSPIPSTSTIYFWPVTTAIGVGSTTITSTITTTISVGSTTTTTIITTAIGGASTTITTTITPSPLVGGSMGFEPLYMPSGTTTTTFALIPSVEPSPEVITVAGGEPVTISFGNVSISTPTSAPSSTLVYVLPTTVYSSGSTTQTFSEDQITSLSAMTTTTDITTTLVEKTTSGSHTITRTADVTWPVNSGGFFWSPVPEPGIPDFPIPTLPDIPPFPDPPCFVFLGIFSIDCPPNKHKPTTHGTSGNPSPTCTADCGTTTKTKTNSNSATTTTSCVTETSTVCQTISSSTVCNEYVGCACPTSTVTDYWVSCSSSSCTTTSSDVITGCYVTATATTTGNYCPSPIYSAWLQDVGDVFPSGMTLVSATTTIPESVFIGATGYPVVSGDAVVGGSTISIEAVSVVTVISLDGTSATLYPGYTGLVPELSGLSVLGLSSPVPIEETSSITSATTTTAPTTTSSTSTATTSGGLPYPTDLYIDNGTVLCYSDYNSDGKYQSFTLSDAQDVIKAFCANDYVLDPGNTYGYVEEGENNIYVSISWAEDQTGCGTEIDFPLSEVGCENAWDLPLALCDGGSSTANYGGGFVYQVLYEAGCILLTIEALSDDDAPTIVNPPFNSTYNSSSTLWQTASTENPTLAAWLSTATLVSSTSFNVST